MKKLRELIEAKVKILSENKDQNVMNVSVPWIQADEKNRNGRTYPKALLQREIARVQGSIRKGSFIGTGDHPSSGIEDIATASHIVTALTMDEKGRGTADLRILPTARGKTIQTLIRNNATLGVSVRGFGNVRADGRVSDDYKLAGLDVVLNPSFKGAVFDRTNIFESLDFGEEKKGGEMKEKLCGLSENYVQEMMEDVYNIYIDEKTFTGSLEDFKNENERIVLAAILIEEGKFENDKEAFAHLDKFGLSEKQKKQTDALDKRMFLEATEMGFHGTQEEFEALLGRPTEDKTNVQKQLTEQQISERIRGYYLEAQRGGFIGSFEEWKEKFPKLVEMAKEAKIVAEKKESKRPISNKITLREAQAGGFKGTADDFEEQYPDMELILPEPPQKIKKVVERELTEKEIIEESARIFTALSKDNPNSQLTLEDVKKLLMKEEEEKVDKRIKRKAIFIVGRELLGAKISREKLHEMVQIEIENLKKERQKRREANWKCFERLLD